jgi:hypothetical protein
MLLAATRPVAIRLPSANLQLVLIAPTIVVPESSVKEPEPRSRRSVRRNATPSPPVEPNPVPPSEDGNPIRPPIDWAGELDRAARDSTAAEASRKPPDFGFPHMSAESTAKPPEFGWSYAPTHRVVSLRGGGLLVNLNDNCVLVFAPLPFFACAPGKKPANGDLFNHMHDPSQAGSGGMP